MESPVEVIYATQLRGFVELAPLQAAQASLEPLVKQPVVFDQLAVVEQPVVYEQPAVYEPRVSGNFVEVLPLTDSHRWWRLAVPCPRSAPRSRSL